MTSSLRSSEAAQKSWPPSRRKPGEARGTQAGAPDVPRGAGSRDPSSAVSNLDEESRWTVHYTAPWHQQENVFLPATRPPCVEDLHRQAKLNLKSVLRECDKLRRDGYRSSQYYSQGPTFAANSSPGGEDDQDDDAETDHKCSLSSSEEDRLISIRRPKTPTSGDFSDLHTQTNWTRSLPLPTPEEKMRQQAQTVQADVVPINITGENFDRQASLRRSLIYTETLVRRPKKVKRRKTITGIPDNIQKELASGTSQEDIGGHSVSTPEHYSTLGRLDGYHLAGQRSETRDSSSQTEDMKVVPPSVRRIRAYKGQGIAAQMSHLPGSSGNMSVLSDSAGIVLPSRLDGDAGFRSLPRSGARTRIQSLESRLGALGPAEEMAGTLPYHRGNLQVDETVAPPGGVSRTGMLLRPRSQELRPLESENLTSPACVVSPHASYSTSIIPNATLSSSSEVIVIHSAQSAGQLDRISSSSSYPKVTPRDHLAARRAAKDGHQPPSGHWSGGPTIILSQALDPRGPGLSLCDSANRENGAHVVPYHCRNNLSFPGHAQDVDSKSESSSSGGRGHGSSEPWESQASGPGRASPLKPYPATPGYSTPTSNMSSGSLDNKEDGGSVYSEDHDGSSPSLLRTDSARGSGHLGSSAEGFGNPRHSVVNVFDGRAQKSQGDRPHDHDKSLSRSISLKKAKKPPLPPSRTDSLRRGPKKSGQANGQVLNESLIATLQHSLQLSLPGRGGSSPSQSPCSDLEEPWLPRSRSQSTVSAGSSLASATTANVHSPCGATPSQSDTSSVKSEYTDPWGYYIDYTSMSEHPGNPGVPTANGPARLVPEGARAAVPPMSSASTKPKIPSPEKSHRVTSPSSGYSSQSNTPTALTPVPVFLKSASPANGKGKAKPKVPERKSSLISSVSVSSSSTSLSSNASTEGSGTVKRLEPALASPPAPPAACPPGSPLPRSPVFPPPPPEALAPFCSPTSDAGLPPPPPLSPLLLDAAASLPAPPPLLPLSEPPPAPPLDPIFLKDPRPSLRSSSQPEPLRDTLRSPPNKEESSRPSLPLITTEVLQMVQLRPVRKSPDAKAASVPEHAAQEQGTPAAPQYHLKPSAVLKARNSINEMESESQPASLTSLLPTPAKNSSQGDHDRAAERGSPPSRSHGAPCLAAGEAESQPGPRTAPLADSSPSRKPPPISKKPKLFLVVPPPQRDCAAEPVENVSVAFRATPSPSRTEEGSVHSQGAPASSHEPDPSSSILEAGAAGPEPPVTVEADVPMVQPESLPTPKQEEPAQSSADDGANVESSLSHQSTEAEVLETDTGGAASESCEPAKEDGSDEVMTPSRPRTTEDLFAAIHRSKRKVLGRKDSDEDHSRNHSPSPPVTPTGSAPSLASPKQVGSIQRSVRKSSTSSDNFKALLLKKGSRSDTGARMSAAEMLKNTDPRFQRSRSEPSPDTPESPSSCSPSKNRKAQEEWARSEGLMPRSLSFSGPRYGRSRAPPSAASSRYSVRNRIQSSPMTVISEGEGEGVEPTDHRARHGLAAAKGRSLDGLAGDAMDQEGVLLRGVESADGTAGAEDGGPSEQHGGAREEEG
nr:NHS-like protein 1 isoform X3 [Oryctolagus cuniculus]